MKLLVIGHSVEDHMEVNGKEEVKPGGIFYAALALKNFIGTDDKIYLNTYAQKENYRLFADVFDRFDKTYVKFIDRIPKVYLKLHNFKERGETYESMAQNLSIESESLNMFDGILINMITGFDVSLEQIKKIRKSFRGLIYFDVHTLSRGLDENLKREFRPVPHFDEWAESIDILQANESEIKTLSSKQNEKEIAEEILNYGVKIFLVTKGKLGARVYTKSKDEIISIFNSSLKNEDRNLSRSTSGQVGCGDVFGAVFFYTYIKTNDIGRSLELANTAAGCAASYNDFKNFSNLKTDVFARYN